MIIELKTKILGKMFIHIMDGLSKCASKHNKLSFFFIK